MAKKPKVSTWNGMPLYSCPYCPHATTDGAGSIDLHVSSAHADQIRLDNLIAKNKKDADQPSEGPSGPTGDLPAGSGGANPTASATAGKEPK